MPVRLVIAGPDGCGKTALLVRYLSKRFIETYQSGIDILYRHRAVLQDSTIDVEILDTSSYERRGFNGLSACLSWADSFLFVYDVTLLDSAPRARLFLELARTVRDNAAVSAGTAKERRLPAVLVGNKTDLAYCGHGNNKAEMEILSSQFRCRHFVTSAAEDPKIIDLIFTGLIAEGHLSIGQGHSLRKASLPDRGQLQQQRHSRPSMLALREEDLINTAHKKSDFPREKVDNRPDFLEQQNLVQLMLDSVVWYSGVWDSGNTAAHLAARRDHLRVLALLRFDAKWLQNKQGAAPLTEAARSGSRRCAKHLLHLLREARHCSDYERRADKTRKRLLKLTDLDGRITMGVAARCGLPELAKDIQRSPADCQRRLQRAPQRLTPQLAAATDQTGRTVLTWAADPSGSSPEAGKCIEYLLHLGADPTAKNEAGNTAANLAARRDHLRVLALLRFDAKWLQNKQGAAPLTEAARSGSRRCAKHLLHLLREARHCGDCERRADKTRKRLLKLTDLDGRTAMGVAARCGLPELAKDIQRTNHLLQQIITVHLETKRFLLKDAAIRDQLISLAKKGDSIGLKNLASADSCDLPDTEGRTVLMWAAGNPDLNSVDLNMFSGNCLHLAASGCNFVAASSLVEAGAPVNSPNLNSSTALMLAALAPDATGAAVGAALLAAGADWSLKDWKGRTALDLAREHRSSDLVELLLDRPFRHTWDNKRPLGRGGFGEVHEVLTDIRFRCAAKTIQLPVQLQHQQMQDDLKAREVRRVVESERNFCLLDHPNIVKFFHIAKLESAKIVLFMELLDGCSLETFIDSKPLDEAICSALSYMHGRKPPVIHRDINCSNMIVCLADNRIKLIDFGLSIKLEQAVSRVTASTSSPKGTLNFLAPELLAPDDPAAGPRYSRKSDIWAFGCSVYQMAAGSRPYSTATNFLQMALQLTERPGENGGPGSEAVQVSKNASKVNSRQSSLTKANPKQSASSAQRLPHGRCRAVGAAQPAELSLALQPVRRQKDLRQQQQQNRQLHCS
uniref:Protein kinase domain-containing protein n=1 Tax=Macrostomum lignano TaxID=282301 RepID=A0A1I8ILH1_9PLAT